MLKRWFCKFAVIGFCFSFISCSTNREYGNRSLRNPTTSDEYVYKKKRRSNDKEVVADYKPIRSGGTKKEETKITSSYESHVISEAEKYLGIPYQYNGKSPNRGFDCSGFVSWVYAKMGKNLSGSSVNQSKKGRRVSKSELRSGDLIFFGSAGKVSHVSIVKEIVESNIYVIHATSSRGVVVDEINNSKYWRPKYLFAKRILDQEDLVQR